MIKTLVRTSVFFIVIKIGFLLTLKMLLEVSVKIIFLKNYTIFVFVCELKQFKILSCCHFFHYRLKTLLQVVSVCI